MKKIILLILCFSTFINFIKAQNELYNNGAVLYVNGQVGTVKNYDATKMPTLYVKGEVVNNSGTLQNATGELQVTGNFTNNATVNSTGDEVFVGATPSTINGTMNGTSTTNNFNNLIVAKNASTTYVNLNTNSNVKNYVEIATGIVRTDVSSHGNDGSAYTNELYTMNTDPIELVTARSGNTEYVEGKLRVNAIATKTYFFPIGAAPSSYDGMEPAEILVNTGSNTILGYIKPATYNFSNFIFTDIGGGATPNALDVWSACTTGPDGILDAVPLSNDFPQEWVFTSSGLNYNITVNPGTILDATEDYTSVCGAGTFKYLLKNGIPGGDGHTIAAGPSTVYIGPGRTLAEFDGVELSPTGNTLTNQSSFSSFRLHGPLVGGGALPVTYLYLTAKAIENSYIKLDWATASEIDNKGFDVERSEDGVNFTRIGWVDGNGNSTAVHNYTLNDNNVVADVVYYYRLRQVDNSGRATYSSIVSARITGEDKFIVSDFIPTKVEGKTHIEIYTTTDRKVSIEIYNTLGQKVERRDEQLQKGTSNVEFDFSQLASGTYSASIRSNGEYIGRKFLVVR